MGIVVCVFMLLGLLMALPWGPPGLRQLRTVPATVDVLATGLLLSGMWNALWHGSRHWSEFWGVAAFVSGMLMMAVALLLLVAHGSNAWRRQALVMRLHAILKPAAAAWVFGLALSFLLYATALIRLNLGLPIPG